MNPGLHSLIVSVEDFGAGGSESGRDGGHVTAMSGALLGESSEISFEIVLFSSKDDTRCSAHSRKASLSEGASADAEAADQGEEWQRHENNWHWWMMMFYQQVSRQASLAGASSGVSVPAQRDGEERHVADLDVMRDMPIFISNMPHDSDRLSHMRTLLGQTLSFRNVSSFPMIPALDSGKVKLLVESGQMHRCAMRRFGANGMKAAGGAIAKAMSNHRLFEELAADSEGPEFVGIFEDDLLLTSEAHEVKQRIRDALKQLPPSADMLYLEVSWESCKDIRFNHEHPAIVRAARPSGGAAHVWTRKGILKMLQVIGQQPWHWYDLMCTHAISAALLEAYMTMPPCFVQDGWFGSNYQRSSEMPNVWCQHDPRAEMTLKSESGAGDSTGRLDRGSAARAVAKSVRVHQPVYPVCVEHFFSPETPFSTMVFTEAHVLSHVHPDTAKIVSRTLVVRNAYFEMGSEASQVSLH